MKYRKLGKTNLKVSVVGVGTWQFGGEWGKDFTQSEVDAIFEKARGCGINFLDTAECYGDHTSEAFIGNAIARDRDQWIIATKFGHKFNGAFQRTDARGAGDVAGQVEGSLKALRTDYIDLLQYHSVRDSEFDDMGVREELAKLVQAGKVRFIGNSIGGNSDGLHQTDGSDKANVSVIQVIYNRLDRRPEQAVFPSCIRQDLGVLARVPLASGFLSGKYKPGAQFPAGDVRSKWRDPKTDEKLAEVQEIAKNEVPAGVAMATWALAWCLKHPAVTAVIPGCKDAHQVEQNAAAADLEMVSGEHPQAWPKHA